jgi:hypothetical protein
MTNPATWLRLCDVGCGLLLGYILGKLHWWYLTGRLRLHGKHQVCGKCDGAGVVSKDRD